MKALLVRLMIASWLLMICAPTYAAAPQRIISGMPSITEMLYALDLADQIVGVTSNCNYPPAAKKKPKVGGFFLNLEKVVSLKSDLVIMLEDAQQKDIQRFKKYGLNVYTINPRSVDDVMSAMLELGAVTDRTKQARQAVSAMESQLRKIEQRTKSYQPSLADVLKLWQPKEQRQQVLVIVGLNPLIVAGGGTFVNDLLVKAGVENVAAKTKGAYPQYNFEQLVQENPQHIIIPIGITTRRQLQADKRWQSLEAVRTGRILFIDGDILSRPGPRVIEAIEIITDFVYTGR